MNFVYLLPAIVGVCGFALAYMIHHKKRSKKPLVCPLKSDCNTVIHSVYSTCLGIPVERLGLLYYAIVVLSYGSFVAFPALVTDQLMTGLLTLSVVAFFFSLYLIGIQLFVLKQWCLWCLVSAGMCTIIFVSSIIRV